MICYLERATYISSSFSCLYLKYQVGILGVWVAQRVKPPTLGCPSVHDLQELRSNPPGVLLWAQSLLKIPSRPLPTRPPPPLAHSLSLQKKKTKHKTQNKNKKLSGNHDGAQKKEKKRDGLSFHLKCCLIHHDNAHTDLEPALTSEYMFKMADSMM